MLNEKMEFVRKQNAIYFIYIGLLQVVTSIDITIEGSKQYYVAGEPFNFTCRFNSTANAVRALQKDNVQEQSLQLAAGNCYNVQPTIPANCTASFCSCSQQADIFIASWNFPISSTHTWKCVQGGSQSPEMNLKPAVPCNITFTQTPDAALIGHDITLTCVTNECRPTASIQWFIGNTNYTKNSTVTVTYSADNLTKVESKLILTATTDLNDQIVSCRAWDIDNTVDVIKNLTLNVQDVETTTAATTKGSGNGGGLSTAQITGIAIAVVVIVCGIVATVIYIVFFKKPNRDGKDSENKKPKGRKSSTVGPIDTPEKKTGNWFKPNCFSVEVTQTEGRDGSVTSRKDVVVDLQDTKTFKGVNSEKSDTPRKLPPLPSKGFVEVDQSQEEKSKTKKKKKKKRAKQEPNQQGKDNRTFDNDQTENVPSDGIGYLETNTTRSNNDNIPSDDQGNLETTTPSNNDNIPSDDQGNLETTTPSNNNNIPSDDQGNLETTTPSNNHNILSDIHW